MKISVVGAYGYTGRLICSELAESNFGFQAVGRDLEKLELLHADFGSIASILQLDIRKKADVDKIVQDSDIIINCAGPFTEESPLLLEKSVFASKIYIDISGEVGFIKQSREKLHKAAIENRTLILHGCAFESLFANLGVQYLSRGASKLREAQSFYWFNKMLTSPGTKITMKLSKFRKLQLIENGHWSEGRSGGKWKLKWGKNKEYSTITYPLPEIAFVHWSYKVDHCCSYLLVDELEEKYFHFSKINTPVTLEQVDQLRKKKKEGPPEDARSKQESIIILRVTDTSNNTAFLSISSKDMYHATAKSVFFAVEKLLDNSVEWRGVIAPANIFKGSELDMLSKLGATLNDIRDIQCRKY